MAAGSEDFKRSQSEILEAVAIVSHQKSSYLSMNIGRLVTAAAVLAIGIHFKGDYLAIGAACALIDAM